MVRPGAFPFGGFMRRVIPISILAALAVAAFSSTSPPLPTTDLDIFSSPYLWKITDPHGEVFWFNEREPTFHPQVPGVWTAELSVQYAHQDPVTGELYIARVVRTFTVGCAGPCVSFDGFESGSLSGWSSSTEESFIGSR